MWVAFAITFIFAAKSINVFAIFKDMNFNATLAYKFVKVWTIRPRKYTLHYSQAEEDVLRAPNCTNTNCTEENLNMSKYCL